MSDQPLLEGLKPPSENRDTIITNKGQLYTVLFGLMLSIFISGADETIVATAMGGITSDLGASNQDVTWLATTYLLTIAACTPLYGKLSDIFGRKPALGFALLVFMIGSLICGAASTPPILIFGRGLAGVGAGGLVSLAFIVLADSVPLNKRGNYMGLVSLTFSMSSIIGPILGGFLVDRVGWRWAFLINLPLVGLSALILLFLAPLKHQNGDIYVKLSRVDWAGSATLVIGVCFIILGLTWGGQTYPWLAAPVLSSLSLGTFVIGCFLFVEYKISPEPIIPSRIFNRNVTAINLASFFMGMPMAVIIYHWPLYFQSVHSATATEAGLELLPMVLGVSISAGLAGILVQATGRYLRLKCLGMTQSIIGLCLMSRLTSSPTRLELILYPLMIGSGIGINLSSNTLIGQASVSQDEMAVVTAVVNFTFTMGNIFGLAIQGAIMSTVLSSELRRVLPELDLPLTLDQLHHLPEPQHALAVKAYAYAYSVMFLTLIPYATLSLIAIKKLRHIPLDSQ